VAVGGVRIEKGERQKRGRRGGRGGTKKGRAGVYSQTFSTIDVFTLLLEIV